jgi:hypothetical protein
MKATIALLASVFLGPCSSSTGDGPQGAGSESPPAAPVATAGSPGLVPAVPAAPSVAATSAPQRAAAQGAPATGPCATLAQKCKKCPAGVVQMACNGALAAGALDPSACSNALEDKDIKAECGAGPAPVASTASAPSAAPPSSATGPCAVLAQKCGRCPPGVAKMACQGALTAGALDPSACTNALADKDIKAQCP